MNYWRAEVAVPVRRDVKSEHALVVSCFKEVCQKLQKYGNEVKNNTEYQQSNITYHIVVCWLVVPGGAEASKSLLEHEYAERVT